MFNKILYIILVVFVSITQTNAQTTFSNIDEVWKYAEEHNITIKTAKYDVIKAGFSKNMSYSALLPQISANGSVTDNTALQTTLIPAQMFGGPAGVYRSVQFGQKYIYNAGFTAQMDILNVQSWLNVKIANETRFLSNDSLANYKKSIYLQIATQYYSYLLMKEAYVLAKHSVAIADSVLFSVNKKFKEGLVNEANVDVAKLNLERTKQTFITSQFQILTSANNLKGLLDMNIADSLCLLEKLDRNIKIHDNLLFEEDPNIRLALKQYNIGLLQYKAVNSSFLPTISLVYSNSTQQNDSKFEPLQSGTEWYPARYWTLKASWLLFNGGGRYYQSKKNKTAFEEKNLLYDNVKKQSVINDENLRLAYKKAIAFYENTKSVMELSYNNYLHITYRYNEGITSIDDRLTAFSDYINYQNQYLNSLSDLLVQHYLIKIRQLTFK